VTDSTTQFFEELGRRGHEPLLEKAKGSLRFDLRRKGQTVRWRVAVNKGNFTVSHKGGPADCTFRADKAVFDAIVTGEMNAAVAVLRGTLEVEGDWELMVLFQRLFPGPPNVHTRGDAGDAGKKR
jgi:putative sterol carrier protein